MTDKTDILIIGGGLAGLSLAASLAHTSLNVTVLESAQKEALLSSKADGRTSALAFASVQMLKALDVWPSLELHSGAITDIRITNRGVLQSGNMPFLHYDHRAVGNEPMGYIAENHYIRKSLMLRIDAAPNIRILYGTSPQNLETRSTHAIAHLADGSTLRSRLVVGADGKYSATRRLSGITHTEWPYEQSGIVCTIAHEKPHDGVALETFLPSGPFAVLPMAGGFHSSLVWTEKTHLTPHYLAMDAESFNEQVALRVGGHLGGIRVEGTRWSYPLSLLHADSYTAQRTALVGDAAHAIHPIAGQGFNLGLRDVAVLAELLVDTAALGLDVGDSAMLERYAAIRSVDALSMIAVTDSLNRLFSNHSRVVSALRTAGLALVEHLPPAKRFFMRHAMGAISVTGGELPKLLRGIRLT